MRNCLLCAAALALSPLASAQQPNAATPRSIKWIDATQLPVEGRPFDDTPDYYCRLPERVMKDPALAKIVGASRYPAGMCYRFRTDSPILKVEWTLGSKTAYGWNSTPCLNNGIDMYRWYDDRGWWYIYTGRLCPTQDVNILSVPWKPGAAGMVYLPIGARVKSVRFGIDENAKIEPLGPRKSGVNKPIVIYGTSMAHGYCSSRPGMTWSAILARRMDVPFVNEGYNGQGRLEPPMAGLLAEIDASAYCFLTFGGNMTIAEAEERFPKFLGELHAKRPDVPILLGEFYYVYGLDYGDGNPKNAFIARLVADLKRENPAFWANLHLVKMSDMFVADGDGTTDTVHVNDRGAWQIAEAFGNVLSKALGIPFPATTTAKLSD